MSTGRCRPVLPYYIHMNVSLDPDILAHFDKDVQTIDEAAAGYAWLLEREMKLRFGAEYIDNLKAAMLNTREDEPMFNLAGTLTAEKGEEAVYKLASDVALKAAVCIAPNFVIALEKSGDGHAVWPAEKLVNIAASDHFVIFHSDFARPGLAEFQANLEYAHYKPGTPDNDLFIVCYTAVPSRTNNASLICVMGIPKVDEHLAEAAALVSGLRFSKENIAQIAMDSTGQHVLPIHGKNIFALTNLSNHPVYTAGLNSNELLKQDCEEAKRVAKENGFEMG